MAKLQEALRVKEIKDAEALRIKEINDTEAEIKWRRARARESGQSLLDDWNGEDGASSSPTC